MSFAVFADGSANLPKSMLDGISLLPCEYTVDGEPQTYWGDVDSFDAHEFYDGLKIGKTVRTSLLNTQLFLSRFGTILTKGTDIIYISMSSGISGTYNAARLAAEELMELYQGRFVHVVDSLGCGFGSGLLAVKAAELSKQGMSARAAADILDVLNIKPVLFGDPTGHIISCAKVRGRRKAIETLVKKYEEKRIKSGEQRICISHGDCLEDAEILAGLVRKITPECPITICQHEPFSGAHVGPGMLGLFFRGTER